MMEFLTEYNLTGLVIGVATFLIIGLVHSYLHFLYLLYII